MYARRRTLPTKPALPVWKWLLPAVLGAGALYAAYHYATLPHDPPLQSSAQARTLAQDWQDLKAFGPRGLGEAGHAKAADWLAAQFRALGYSVTELPVMTTRPVDAGSTLTAGQQQLAVTALYGAGGGEQTGRLVRVPPQASSEDMGKLGLQTQIALTTCPAGTWAELVDRVLRAGAFGLVLIDDCPVAKFEPVLQTPMPLVKVAASQKAAVLALAGQQVKLTSKVEQQEVGGKTILARHVGATPALVFGAHLDTLPTSLGANRDASGVLTVLELARRAAKAPLGDQAWFVVFDGTRAGMLGSRDFVPQYAYPLRQTRAMLNFDGVGVGEPLGAAAHAELDPIIRQVDPQLRLFEEPRDPQQRPIGKALPLVGNSDHLAFKQETVRTVLLQRGGLNPFDKTLGDDQLDLGNVQKTADFAQKFAAAVLAAPWQPKEPCGLTGRNCY